MPQGKWSILNGIKEEKKEHFIMSKEIANGRSTLMYVSNYFQ